MKLILLLKHWCNTRYFLSRTSSLHRQNNARIWDCFLGRWRPQPPSHCSQLAITWQCGLWRWPWKTHRRKTCLLTHVSWSYFDLRFDDPSPPARYATGPQVTHRKFASLFLQHLQSHTARYARLSSMNLWFDKPFLQPSPAMLAIWMPTKAADYTHDACIQIVCRTNPHSGTWLKHRPSASHQAGLFGMPYDVNIIVIGAVLFIRIWNPGVTGTKQI